MKSWRDSLLWLMATTSRRSALITPLQALQQFPQLSTFQNYINASPNFTSLLSSADNFTLLAPTNDAFATFTNQIGNISNTDLLEATLQYSLLAGGYPKLSFSNTPQFVASKLDNATYSNVTGGQRVELVLGSDGTPQVVTSNRTISTTTSSDIICVGGIIHIINEVVAVPISTVLEISAAGLEYVISILNVGGYLSSSNNYVNTALTLPDVTYFIPNSAAALGNATALLANSTMAEQQTFFEYHLVNGTVAYSSDLTNGTQFKTASGANVTVTVQDGDTYINSAKITAFDYVVANGVFHVLDNILDIHNTSARPPPASSTSSSSSSTPNPTPTIPPSATSIVASSTSTATTHPSSSSLSTGAKAGIGVGAGVGALAIIALLAFCLIRMGKRRRESIPWGGQEVPNMGKFYVQRGTVHRHDDLGLGLESSTVQGDDAVLPATQSRASEGASYGSSSSPSRPSVPPRSPSRVNGRQDFF